MTVVELAPAAAAAVAGVDEAIFLGGESACSDSANNHDQTEALETKALQTVQLGEQVDAQHARCTRTYVVVPRARTMKNAECGSAVLCWPIGKCEEPTE